MRSREDVPGPQKGRKLIKKKSHNVRTSKRAKSKQGRSQEVESAGTFRNDTWSLENPAEGWMVCFDWSCFGSYKRAEGMSEDLRNFVFSLALSRLQ